MLRRFTIGLLAGVAFLATPSRSAAQRNVGQSALRSRAELDSLAQLAERAALKGDDREHNTETARLLRERLREGDFKVGDRIAVTVQIDSTHTDTLIVRTGRMLQIPAVPAAISLAGVLRSEVQPLVQGEVLKYIRARRVDVVPMMRIAVMGEVARPSFYDFVSDAPITTAIMAAGGPSAVADMSRSVHRRAGSDVHSSQEIAVAIDRGLTLDQFGLQAGDEILIGRRKEFNLQQYIGYITTLAGLASVWVVVHNAQQNRR